MVRIEYITVTVLVLFALYNKLKLSSDYTVSPSIVEKLISPGFEGI